MKKKLIEINYFLILVVMQSQNANLRLCSRVYMSLLSEISLIMDVKDFVIVQKQITETGLYMLP